MTRARKAGSAAQLLAALFALGWCGGERPHAALAGGADGGRCLLAPVEGGDGAVVLYDTVVNLRSRRVFFVGPHKVLWIVPQTPALQAKTVSFNEHFGEGRDLHWLPRRHDAASLCVFARPNVSSVPPTPTSAGDTVADDTTYVMLHGDPYEHVNLASCPLPTWAVIDLQEGRDLSVSVTLAPKPLFQALPCTESNGSHVSACAACRQLVASMHGSHLRPDADECLNSSRMSARVIRLAPLRVCVPAARVPVALSLCCIMKNEARYLREWLEFSRLVGVERFYLYDHNSSDSTREVLAPYLATGTVVLHDWSFPGYPQKEAHTHCTHRYAHETTWLGLLDVDEFLVPVKAASVVDILEATPVLGLEHVVVRLSAAMYGTSGHTVMPQGLVTEEYLLRNRSSNSDQHKVIFRASDATVMLPGIHEVLSASAVGVVQVDVHPDDLYYNHYRTKSKQDHEADPLRKALPLADARELVDDTIPAHYSAALRHALHQDPEKGWGLEGEKPGLGSSQQSQRRRIAIAQGNAVLGATVLRSQYSFEEQCPGLVQGLGAVLRRNESVVEVGCGSGYLVTELEEAGFDIVGLDNHDYVASLLPESRNIRSFVLEGSLPPEKPRGQVLSFLHASSEAGDGVDASLGGGRGDIGGGEQTEREDHILRSVCALAESRAVIGWGRRCQEMPSPMMQQHFGHSGGGEEVPRELWCQSDHSRSQQEKDGGLGSSRPGYDVNGFVDPDGPLDPVMRVVRTMAACGLAYSPQQSVQVWEPLRRRRQEIRPLFRQQVLAQMEERQAKSSYPPTVWCDGTSSVMVFERLSPGLLLEQADALPSCPGGRGFCVELTSPPAGGVVVVNSTKFGMGAEFDEAEIDIVVRGFTRMEAGNNAAGDGAVGRDDSKKGQKQGGSCGNGHGANGVCEEEPATVVWESGVAGEMLCILYRVDGKAPQISCERSTVLDGMTAGMHEVAVAAVTSTGVVMSGWSRSSFAVMPDSLVVDVHGNRAGERAGRGMDPHESNDGGGPADSNDGNGTGGPSGLEDPAGANDRGEAGSDGELSDEVADGGGERGAGSGGTEVGNEAERCGFEQIVDAHHCYGMERGFVGLNEAGLETITAADCHVACCDDASCQHWMFSPVHGCWTAPTNSLRCVPNGALFGHWVGQRKRSEAQEPSLPSVGRHKGAEGVSGELTGGGGAPVGQVEALLGLSASNVKEVMGQIAEGLLEAVDSELGSRLQKHGNSRSWLQEVYVRLHVWLHRAHLLPLGGADVWGHERGGELVPTRAMEGFVKHVSERYLAGDAAGDGGRAGFASCLRWGDHVRPGLLNCEEVYQRHVPEEEMCNGHFGVIFRGGDHLLCAGEGDLATVVNNLPLPTSAADVDGAKSVQRFSLIVCTQVMGRVQDPAEAVLELFSVLAPGGWLIITLPAAERGLYADVPQQPEVGGGELRMTRSEHRFTLFEAQRLLVQAGLCVRVVRTAGTSMSTTGYMLGMSGLDLPQEGDERGESGDTLRYFGVYALGQRPPCDEQAEEVSVGEESVPWWTHRHKSK